jgi:hypothetical protein
MQVDDLYTFVGVVEQRVGGRLSAASTFLGGQSMGGLVAALGALRCQERWAGLVVFSGAMGVVWTLVLRYGKCRGCTWCCLCSGRHAIMHALLVHICCSSSDGARSPHKRPVLCVLCLVFSVCLHFCLDLKSL